MKHRSSALLALAILFATPSASTAGDAPGCDCPAASVPKVVHKAAKPKRHRPAVRPAALPAAPALQAPSINPVASSNINIATGSHECVTSGTSSTSGQPWTDRNCLLLSKSTTLWTLGKQDAAIALLCSDAEIRAALEISGTACPPAPGSR